MLDLAFVEGHLLQGAASSPLERFGSLDATMSVSLPNSPDLGRSGVQEKGHLLDGGVLLQLLKLEALHQHGAHWCSCEQGDDVLWLWGQSLL